MRSLFQSFRKPKTAEYITIVSGLPRSGTSMMMKMLEAGGLPSLTDDIRKADDDNPKGYYEFERVKKMPDGDTAWIEEAHGKTVKVISALLEHLPPDVSYRVLFMQRNMDEILASQKKMLVHSGKPTDKVSDDQLTDLYAKHLAKIKLWLSKQPNFYVLYLDYNAILDKPMDYIDTINDFLDNSLNAGKMAEVIDPNLYRQRR
jgi:hypothetical protein